MKLLAAFALTLFILGLLLISYAHAEMQGLYVNADNRGWVLTSTHISEDECDKAARRVWREGKVIGVGCARFTPEREQAQRPAAAQQEYKSKEQQWRDDARQVEKNRQERYEMQFSRPIPR